MQELLWLLLPGVQINAEKLALWTQRGARPSLTVQQLIKRSGVAVGEPVAAVPEPAEGQA